MIRSMSRPKDRALNRQAARVVGTPCGHSDGTGLFLRKSNSWEKGMVDLEMSEEWVGSNVCSEVNVKDTSETAVFFPTSGGRRAIVLRLFPSGSRLRAFRRSRNALCDCRFCSRRASVTRFLPSGGVLTSWPDARHLRGRAIRVCCQTREEVRISVDNQNCSSRSRSGHDDYQLGILLAYGFRPIRSALLPTPEKDIPAE